MTSTRADTGLYVEVQHFYAKQMQSLDARKLEAYAGTFTEDAEFAHTPNREPARTRAGIVRDLYDFHRERFDGDPVQLRHYFNMIDIESQEDSIRSTCYALVILTRPGGKPEIAASCVVHDALVHTEDGLLIKSRRIDYDQLL